VAAYHHQQQQQQHVSSHAGVSSRAVRKGTTQSSLLPTGEAVCVARIEATSPNLHGWLWFWDMLVMVVWGVCVCKGLGIGTLGVGV
jgi:hypothetical protein